MPNLQMQEKVGQKKETRMPILVMVGGCMRYPIICWFVARHLLTDVPVGLYFADFITYFCTGT